MHSFFNQTKYITSDTSHHHLVTKNYQKETQKQLKDPMK